MGAGKIIGGIAAVLAVGAGAVSVATSSHSLLRPPGSQGEKDFMSRCIKCGKCIEACPYQAVHAAGIDAGAACGTPCITARDQACRMCEDFPCVNACPTGALRDVETRADVNMGYAVIDEVNCIAFKGMRCEVCYRACPLLDEAIMTNYEEIEDDSIHVKFIPTIDKDVCTGCGLCVMRCVVSDPVPIRIKTLAEQGK